MRASLGIVGIGGPREVTPREKPHCYRVGGSRNPGYQSPESGDQGPRAAGPILSTL